MPTLARWRSLAPMAACVVIAVLAVPSVVTATTPVVKTVPWVTTNPLIPHDTWSGRTITLKGTTTVQGATFQWTWDFGDGSAVATGAVSNMFAIEAQHAYSGADGTIFTARLTVRDTNTGEFASKEYLIELRPKTLDVEVNVAIDEGLWYLHKAMYRYTSGSVEYGTWTSGSSYASMGYYGVTAANLNAFEVNGHLETGNPDNPYVDTVQRAMRWVFTAVAPQAIPVSQTNGVGTFNPDANGNGYAVYVPQYPDLYQLGIFMDAIVASGTPNAITTTGTAPSGANPGILGRTYSAIVQDMVDWYSYCQYDSSGGGGWRYSCNQFPDNSAAQWAAIGIIASQGFGATIPAIVKQWNLTWLNYSQYLTPGIYYGQFGYTDTGTVWGPYGTTPSGMVQLAMNGLGRGNTKWDAAETFMRNNFGNTGGAYTAVKDYYYGLFALTKALLLHDSNADGVPEPLSDLRSQTSGVVPIDWYAAETVNGAPTNGIARELVGDQAAAGYWWGHNVSSEQYYLETAWAIMMLNRTLFTAGAPVAVASATPNPATAGATITLDGTSSFHQDPAKHIDSWDWDLNNDGVFELSGPKVTTTFPALGAYAVVLRVTDDGTPEALAKTTITVVVSTPPLAPTANAGGPYNFCLNPTLKFFLDGSKSVNPDDAQHDPGAPGDFIKSWAWDLTGNGQFSDASGAKPDVTTFFTSRGAGSYLIQLKVTDNTALSFPSANKPDLTDVDSAQVVVRASTDPACGCVTLTARPKTGLVELRWTAAQGAAGYALYRSTVSGGPYVSIAATTAQWSVFIDKTVVNGTTYYYVIRPYTLNLTELCQSNQASAKPTLR